MSRVPILFLAVLFAIPDQAAQRIPGLERRITNPRTAIAGGSQWVASATASDDEFVVAWQNRRSFYASRLTPPFPELGATPLRIDIAGTPHVVAIRGHYVAVWKEQGVLYAGRLSATGVPEERMVIGTVAEQNEDISFALANDAAVAVVVIDWASEQMRVRLLDENGRPDSEWHDAGRAVVGGIAAGADPGGFFLAGARFNEIHAIRVTNAGDVIALTVPKGEPDVARVLAAFDGTHYILALINGEGTRGLLVAPDGSVQSEIFPIVGAGHYPSAIVGRPGGSLLFVYGAPGNPAGTSAVSIDHAPRRVGNPIAIAADVLSHVVSNGTSVLALWNRYTGQIHVKGQWIDAAGGTPLSDAFDVCIGSQEQIQPAIAFGSDVDLVVWEEATPAGRSTIAAARIARDGSVLDDVPLQLSASDAYSAKPAVTFDGSEFIVVWGERMDAFSPQGRLTGRRVRQDGSLNGAPFVIADQFAAAPVIAHSGDITLIAWEGLGTRTGIQTFTREIFGTRLSRTAGVLDSVPLLISRDSHDHLQPDIIAGDDQFLVGWKTYYWPGGHAPTNAASSVALVTAGGTVGEPIVLRPYGEGNASAPQVAWNGSEFFAAWEERSKSFAQRIRASGTLIGSRAQIPLANVADAAFFEGSWHVLSGATEVFGDGILMADIRGVYLTSALELESIVHPAISSDIEVEPMLASDGARATIVYRRMVSNPPSNGSGTVVFRMYDDTPSLQRRRSVR